MWEDTCGDPYCPNKRRVQELETQVGELQMKLAEAAKPQLGNCAHGLETLGNRNFDNRPKTRAEMREDDPKQW